MVSQKQQPAGSKENNSEQIECFRPLNCISVTLLEVLNFEHESKNIKQKTKKINFKDKKIRIFIQVVLSRKSSHSIIIHQFQSIFSKELQVKRDMGACDSKSEYKQKQRGWNPIIQFLKITPIEELEKQWDQYEAEMNNKDLEKNAKRFASFSQFSEIFPSLGELSDKPRKKLSKMLDLQGIGALKRKDLITFRIIASQIDSPELISQIIYYMYSEQQKIDPKSSELKCIMTPQGLESFKIDNQQRINELKVGSNRQKKQQQKQQQKKEEQKSYTLEQFQSVFEEYEYLKFYQLFRTSHQNKMQEELVKIVKKDRKLFSFEMGMKVYMVEYSWFSNWCSYMKKKYKVSINYSNSLAAKESAIKPNQPSYLSPTSKYSFKQKNLPVVDQNQPAKKPDRINNYLIMDSERNQLKDGLVDGVHYVMVNRKVWNLFMKSYGGSPSIQRKYPEIYAISVYTVNLDQLGFLIPKQLKQDIVSKSDTIEKFIPNTKGFAWYYKYIGLQNWTRIKKKEVTFGELVSSSVVYIVNVPSKFIEDFQHHYNVQTNTEGQKRIDIRIKNYASIINIKIDGALTKGAITQIFPHSVEVSYKNEENVITKKKIREVKLKDLNPSDLGKDKKLNYLAGMNNFENNCYMNSTVQCLIKTPYLRQLLESFITEELKKSEESIIQGLLEICYNSLTQDIIDMQKFKKKMQTHLQFFQGNSHQDAQQFLLALFQQISKESKSLNKYEEKIGLKKVSIAVEHANSKILKDFAGLGFATTQCQQCHNKKETISEFYTYSLNLPDCTEYQIGYFIIPKDKSQNFKIQECLMTLDENDTVETFKDKFAKVHKIDVDDYKFYSCSNGQLYTEISNQPYKKMEFFQTYGMKLIIYEIDPNSPGYYLEIQMRSQMYDKKSYKMYEIPILLQILPNTSWQNIQEQIIQIFSGRFNEVVTAMTDKDSVSKASQTSKQTKLSKNVPFIIEYLRTKKKAGTSPIRIRFLDKSSGKCFICQKEIPFSMHVNIGFNYCKECLPENQSFGSLKKFRSQKDSYVIMLDWDCPERFMGLDIELNETVEIAKQNYEKRKIKLLKVLHDNFDNAEEIDLNCQQKDCKSKRAIRKQGIRTFPKILIIHLNRFRYKQNGLVKINNYIEYDNSIKIENEEYELYGSVVHDGTCHKGHYYNYVLHDNMWFCCNDERVFKVENNEQLNSNVYLLFYKKKKQAVQPFHGFA